MFKLGEEAVHCECVDADHPAEFVEFKQGLSLWTCLNCGGLRIKHEDCLGG